MTRNKAGESIRHTAGRVVRVCLIVCSALTVLVITLKLIRGDNLLHAVSSSISAFSALVVMYWLILFQNRSPEKIEVNSGDSAGTPERG